MLPSKKDIFHAALDQAGQPSGRVLVTLIHAVPGVAVGDFAQDVLPQAGLLTLAFTLRGKEPLDTDDVGIRGVLGRGGRPVPVFIPWAAVSSIREESTGNCIRFQYATKVEAEPIGFKPAPTQAAKRGGLRLVKPGEEN